MNAQRTHAPAGAPEASRSMDGIRQWRDAITRNNYEAL